MCQKIKGREVNPQSIRSGNETMPTLVDMEIDKPGEEHGDVQHTPLEEATIKIQSPPHVKRTNKDIEPTPKRKDDAVDDDGTNHVMPAKEEQKSARKNKDPKRTKVQTLDAYFGKLRENKQEICEHTSVTEVITKRTKGGRRLVPSGTMKKLRVGRAEKPGREVQKRTRWRGPRRPFHSEQAMATARPPLRQNQR